MTQSISINNNTSNELNAIFENAAVVLILMDKDGRTLNINKAGLQMIRKPRQDVIGRLTGEVFSCINAIRNNKIVCGKTEACKHCTIRQQLNASIDHGAHQFKEEGTINVFQEDNSQLLINLLVSTSNVNINNDEYILLTIDDISKIKKQEEELKRLNEHKDKFLSILSHDLRNPFNSLIGFTEILLNHWQEYPKEKTDKILNSLLSVEKNAYSLLNDLLSWAKSQSGQIQFEPQNIPVTEIFNSVLSTIQHAADLKEIKIQLENKDNSSIFADSKMLSTILRNLTSNAIKFTEKGKKITIIAQSTPTKTSITVKDEGTGIPEEKIDHLFDITQVESRPGTDGEKGSGLGLILCKEFIDKHHGTINVTSKIGQGSEFTFTFPQEKNLQIKGATTSGQPRKAS